MEKTIIGVSVKIGQLFSFYSDPITLRYSALLSSARAQHFAERHVAGQDAVDGDLP